MWECILCRGHNVKEVYPASEFIGPLLFCPDCTQGYFFPGEPANGVEPDAPKPEPVVEAKL